MGCKDEVTRVSQVHFLLANLKLESRNSDAGREKQGHAGKSLSHCLGHLGLLKGTSWQDGSSPRVRGQLCHSGQCVCGDGGLCEGCPDIRSLTLRSLGTCSLSPGPSWPPLSVLSVICARTWQPCLELCPGLVFLLSPRRCPPWSLCVSALSCRCSFRF